MKKRKIISLFVLVFITLITYYISYNYTLNELPNKYLYFLSYKYQSKNKYKIDIISMTINSINNNKKFILKNNSNKKLLLNINESNNPIVYIYNTHSEEEYNYQKNNSYNIIPTVKEANYILENELKKLGINSIIEQNNTTKLVNERGLPYSSSYKVSRELLENKKMEYPSLIYFIDIHRDSVERSITTINIDGKSYARIMFLIGLENNNYQENKNVVISLNNYLEKTYKGLSRGIYEKKGKGVNGIYNQDFNKNVMLIEVGGVDNTIEEVFNSLKILADCLYQYIKEDNTTKLE